MLQQYLFLIMQTLAFSNMMTTVPVPVSRSFRLPCSVSATLRCDNKVTHSMAPEKKEVFKSLEPWATDNLLPFLKPVEKSWQPTEFLPNPSRTDKEFIDEVRALRARASGMSDEYLVVLVGDMITEEALPTYQTVFNMGDGIQDDTGASLSPWACWNRGWSAEENRHGDLLKTYLYLSGKVDMVMVERTIQYLIGAGMDIGTENNPYLGFVYTAFQERATFVSHLNTSRLAKLEGGDPILARICGSIASDEKRHENAYIKIVEKLLEVDTNAAMVGIGDIIRKKITMPAHLMWDGQDPHLFEHFSTVAQRLGVYTVEDYANILEFLVGRWDLEKTEGLKGDGRKAQEYVCGLAPRIRKLHEWADDRVKKLDPIGIKFSWIFNKEIVV